MAEFDNPMKVNQTPTSQDEKFAYLEGELHHQHFENPLDKGNADVKALFKRLEENSNETDGDALWRHIMEFTFSPK